MTAKMTTRMMPTTKAGRADAAEDARVTPRSNQPPRRTAARVPAPPPMMTARMMASTAMDRLTGSRWPMLWATGIWLK